MEDQCVANNIGIIPKYNLVPHCKNMNPITCIIPNPIENGLWICPCSGLGEISSDDVLVYTNCTQQCKDGYELVGDSFGHCGERQPYDKNSPTEFRYGNARCVKKEAEDQHTSGILLLVSVSCSVTGIVILLVVSCCCYKCYRQQKDKTSYRRSTANNRLHNSDIQSVTPSEIPGTVVTTTTALTAPDPDVSTEGTVVTTTTALTAPDPDVSTEGIPVVTISHDAYSTNTGATVTLGCTVTAKPAHTIVCWQRNVDSETVPITIDGVIYTMSTVNSPSLTIHNADTSDSGTYTCFVTNSVGTGQSAPTTLTVTRSVNCDAHLDNLPLKDDEALPLSALNELDSNQKPRCYRMAMDIVKRVFPTFHRERVERELTHLCDKKDPVMEVLFEFLKNYPCYIGDVVHWCVRNKLESLVKYLVSEEHEKTCDYCSNMKRNSTKRN
ncbi:uncharacterized protein LOC132560187 isoform X2 [Ylistrum balloti]|uniref:uncharacterized protein LOC132560187 isoform X2 n=1 Tax=Ylistrum balloti TaxID=509963 RepID=UPI002905F5DF|nr:uncharacterized protein LOC132560187 isoform X2 [Ylistrum balloti]